MKRPEALERENARLRKAGAAPDVLPAEGLIPAPDCGMKHPPRATAFPKPVALAKRTAMLRRDLA